MQLHLKRRKAHIFVSAISLGLLLCGLPMLAQSGSDNSGSTGGTTSGAGTTQNRDTNRGSDFNPAWLGLLGLAGLAGLSGRRHTETHEVSRARMAGQ